MSDRSGSDESEEEQEQQQQPEFHYENPVERRRREAAEARQRLAAEERAKQEEKERKKAEVRRRLEEAAKAKKGGKKGFMTPERKKKLRSLLRQSATEALKREQERRAEFRKKCIIERCGQRKPIEHANEATLQAICKEYHARIVALEDIKYDLEYEVRQKDYVINELNVQLNDLRGKFVKPNLKKVSKYEAKFEKLKQMAMKSAEHDYRTKLKATKKKSLVDDEEKEKPEWALGKPKTGTEE